MADAQRLITAAELDEMTPDERARAFNDRVVTSLDQLPADVRARVCATAALLSEHRKRSTVE